MLKALAREHMNLDACTVMASGGRFVDCCIANMDFLNAETAREQIYVGINYLISIHKMDLVSACKEMCCLLKCKSYMAVRRLYDSHRLYLMLPIESRREKSLSTPGRPRLISYEQILNIVAYVASMFFRHRVLTFETLCCFIETSLKSLHLRIQSVAH